MESKVETGPAATRNDDAYSVWWEEPADRDPENPMSWSNGRKWGMIATISFLSFLTPLASSMMAPGVPQIMKELGSSNDTEATFVVSIFILGFAFGPLFIAPLSELYGRIPIYHVCNSLFVVFSACCALSNGVPMLMAFRFLSGVSGVAVITCGSGSIADMMPPEQRGRAISLWSLGPLTGPVVGPVCAGFLVEAKGWRWVFWIITIVSGVAVPASFFILRESYAPVLLERKAKRLREETGNDLYQPRTKEKGTARELFLAAIIRPTRMFCLSFIVMAMCVYLAVVYGIFYILLTTFTFVYKDAYGFNSIGAGLSFIPGGIGNILGLAYVGVLSDNLIKKRKAQGLEHQPEQRLHPIISVPTGLAMALGLICYGWTADKQVHWIAPMIGTGIVGFGMLGIFMSVQTYLVDMYTTYAASVTAANTVLRSVLGALLPLCGLQLYDSMGLGWGNTLLGLIVLFLAPFPWLFYQYGGRIRQSPKFRTDF
ncbi:uncharacterized protein FPRO_03451 [Fusarium proliferatum ET1]|uniref:Related to multidrug resistant protein n=1 Tax=Fusarium proliferatum (strain ET1) TaxID=1227346 RepID=A0A1L7V615_FUSPR|nr:uncharacterized protein FPRO_03451 [Fusarium proliferatum ET1]CZR36289.1 related to multidrug resistant protein [Fusarium proliferatum ET1]